MVFILSQIFFNRSPINVAKDLLGKFLVCRTKKGIRRAMITEVEAYDGPQDKACHASKGLTQRTAPMFGPAGYWYVYLIYGMYWMLNIVTREEGYPAAVLIRGIAKITNTDEQRSSIDTTPHLCMYGFVRAHHDMQRCGVTRVAQGCRSRIEGGRGGRGRLGMTPCDGPGKLTKYFCIDNRFNAHLAHQKTALWIEDSGVVVPEKQIKRTPRIGVEYAGECAQKPYRFILSS